MARNPLAAVLGEDATSEEKRLLHETEIVFRFLWRKLPNPKPLGWTLFQRDTDTPLFTGQFVCDRNMQTTFGGPLPFEGFDTLGIVLEITMIDHSKSCGCDYSKAAFAALRTDQPEIQIGALV